MKRELIIGILLFAFQATFSQTIFSEKGYIIKTSGDTIYGKIENLGDISNCAKVKLYDSAGVKIKIKFKEIKAYKRGQDFYVKRLPQRPMTLSGTPKFMKVVTTGKVNVYLYTYDVQNESTMLENAVITSFDPDYGVRDDYYLEKDGKLVLVKKFGFRDSMIIFFADSKEIVRRLKSEEFGIDDFKKMVEIYNQE